MLCKPILRKGGQKCADLMRGLAYKTMKKLRNMQKVLAFLKTGWIRETGIQSFQSCAWKKTMATDGEGRLK